jgi:hypothetical protein
MESLLLFMSGPYSIGHRRIPIARAATKAFRASWFDSTSCRSMNIDHGSGRIYLYGDWRTFLDSLGFCFQMGQWENLFPFRCGQFDLLLHFAEMNQLSCHILMLAFLTFEMDINDGIVFVQKKCDLVALFKGLMAMALGLVCIYLIGSSLERLYSESPRRFCHDAANRVMALLLFNGCRTRSRRIPEHR